MMVFRFAYTVKLEKREELAALLKAEKERVGYPHAVRVYGAETGPPSNIVIEEMEYESMEEWRALGEGWWNTPEFSAYGERVSELMEPPLAMTTETWELL